MNGNGEASPDSKSLEDALAEMKLEQSKNLEKWEKSWDHSVGSHEHQPPQQQSNHQSENKRGYVFSADIVRSAPPKR